MAGLLATTAEDRGPRAPGLLRAGLLSAVRVRRAAAPRLLPPTAGATTAAERPAATVGGAVRSERPLRGAALA